MSKDARGRRRVPCGGQGTQHGGRQNDCGSNPVIVPGPIEIGRSGPPHCCCILPELAAAEMFATILRKREDLRRATNVFFTRMLLRLFENCNRRTGYPIELLKKFGAPHRSKKVVVNRKGRMAVN